MAHKKIIEKNSLAYFLIFFFRRLWSSLLPLVVCVCGWKCVCISIMLGEATSAPLLAPLPRFLHRASMPPLPRAAASSAPISSSSQLYFAYLPHCAELSAHSSTLQLLLSLPLSSTWSLTQFLLHCLNGNAKSSSVRPLSLFPLTDFLILFIDVVLCIPLALIDLI